MAKSCVTQFHSDHWKVWILSDGCVKGVKVVILSNAPGRIIMVICNRAEDSRFSMTRCGLCNAP